MDPCPRYKNSCSGCMGPRSNRERIQYRVELRMESTVASPCFPMALLSSVAYPRSSNSLRLGPSSCGVLEVQWRRMMRISWSAPRFVCLFGGKGKQDSDDTAKDAARKALERALGGKKNIFSKWDEEIKKREAEVGERGGGGRGWFGGGGGGSGDSGDEDFWEEILQVTLATIALIFLYLMIIKGKETTAFALNSVLFLLRRFRSKVSGRSKAALQTSRPKSSSTTENLEDEDEESSYEE